MRRMPARPESLLGGTAIMTLMQSRSRNLFAGIAIAAALLLVSVRPVFAKDCDRACLGDLVTQYLKDMTAHNPAALPVSPNVRFTENGDGLWRTASGLGTYRQDILDVAGHTAATQAVVLEDGDRPVLLALRLKERDGKITEIETMVVPHDKSSLLFDPAGYEKGNEQMTFVPPASEIGSPAEAIEIAMKYPQGLKVGRFVQADK